MRSSPSEVVIRAGHPAARPGVTAEPASPLGVVRPFSVLSAGEVAAYWILRALLRPRALASSGPWSFSSPTAPRVVSEQGAHPLLGFHSPTGYCRSQPQHREPFTRRLMIGAVPLLGFESLQRSPARRVRFTRWLPHHRHLASSGFFALPTPYSPSSLPTVARRAAPGILPSGLCSCQSVRRPFGPVPSLPDVTHPDRRTLAMTSDRTRALIEGINPRERTGRPSSRPIRLAIRTSAALVYGSAEGRCPLGFHPHQGFPRQVRRTAVAARSARARFVHHRLPCGSRPWLRLSVLPDPGVGVVSLETASPPEVSPIGQPTNSRGTAVLGHGLPSRTEVRYRTAGSPIRTAETPYRSSVGRPSGPHRATPLE
jgi:hypothetical protein